MIDNLHKWLLRRLTLICLVLSLVSGGFVYYFGNVRLESHVVNMAKSEMSTYAAESIEYLQSPSDQALLLFKQKIQGTIEKDNLITVELSSIDSTKIVEVTKSTAMNTVEKPPRPLFDLSRNDDVFTEKRVLYSGTYLYVHIFLRNNSNVRIGYLDGLYRAPDEIISEIKHQSFWSFVFVVIAIFVTSLALYPFIIRLNNKLLGYSHILALTNVGMLEVLGSAIAKRDSDTNIHNYRVTLYSVRLGERLGLSNVAMQGLIKGAFLHDVGKIAITDSILRKPGRLTNEEFEIMKTHVRHGEDIIKSYAWLKDANDVVRCHHEKFDGSGYPSQLKGEDIPFNARIFAVADVFDALTSKRPYKKSFSFEASLKIILESQGSHLDRSVVRQFLEYAEAFYNEICTEDEAILHKKLEDCISRYFVLVQRELEFPTL